MGVPAKSARRSSSSVPSGSSSSGIGSASSAVTKFGSSMPSAVVPQDQQTSNESSTLDRHFGQRHMICAPTKLISKPGPLTNDSHEGTRRSKKKLHQPGCTSQLVSVGQRSANQNPSRSTTSPTVTRMSLRNSGHR